MERLLPNFKGARILGFCLNVMGFTVSNENYAHDGRALQRAILSWTKKNYAWLYSYNCRVAEACLVDGLTFDAENLRLVTTYPAEGLRREPHYVYFKVVRPSIDEGESLMAFTLSAPRSMTSVWMPPPVCATINPWLRLNALFVQ